MVTDGKVADVKVAQWLDFGAALPTPATLAGVDNAQRSTAIVDD